MVMSQQDRGRMMLQCNIEYDLRIYNRCCLSPLTDEVPGEHFVVAAEQDDPEFFVMEIGKIWIQQFKNLLAAGNLRPCNRLCFLTATAQFQCCNNSDCF